MIWQLYKCEACWHCTVLEAACNKLGQRPSLSPGEWRTCRTGAATEATWEALRPEGPGVELLVVLCALRHEHGWVRWRARLDAYYPSHQVCGCSVHVDNILSAVVKMRSAGTQGRELRHRPTAICVAKSTPASTGNARGWRWAN